MFSLKIETSNAAFTDDPAAEIARALREVADKIEGAGGRFYSAPVRDVNGNRVGRIEFDAEQEA